MLMTLNTRKTTSRCLATLAAWMILVPAQAQTPLTTEINYQGQLQDGDAPVNATLDFRFRLYDADSAGNQIGATDIHSGIAVVDGLIQLQLDFGNAYNGDARWLEIDVREGADPFTTLAPRQPVSAAPHALTALNVPGIDGNSLNAINDGPENALTVDVDGDVGIGVAPAPVRLAISDGGAPVGIAQGHLGTNAMELTTADGGGQQATRFMITGNVAAPDMRFYSGANGAEALFAEFDANNNGGRMLLKDDAGTNRVETSATTNGGQVKVADPAGTVQASMFANGNGGTLRALDTAGAVKAQMNVGSSTAGDITVYGPNGNLNAAVAFINGSEDHGFMGVYDTSGSSRAQMSVGSNGAGDMTAYGPNGNRNAAMGFINGDEDSGFMGVYDSSGVTQASMFVNGSGNGQVTTDVLQITGGADIAEPFDIHVDPDTATTIEPGMIVAIDPERVGALRLSTQAYDRTVAGIISGAGGVNPGMTLQQPGTLADGTHPVALTGRVWCYVDAAFGGPVQAGDLLTTSDTPGHAMKVTDHDRAHGAVIGKAMTALESGRGLVLVLVSLH